MCIFVLFNDDDDGDCNGYERKRESEREKWNKTNKFNKKQ